MYVHLRRFVIRFFLPLAWRFSRNRPARALAEFAATESDSGWQFLRAIDSLPDPKHRALLFHNLLEEKEHAHMFRVLVDTLPGGRTAHVVSERRALIDEGGLAEFLAYVYGGELDISLEFDAYAKAASVPEARALFRHIQLEEEGHHTTLWTALMAAAESEAHAHKLVRVARRKRAWRAWLRFSKRLGTKTTGFLLTIIYVVLGPFLFWANRRRVTVGRVDK